MTGPRQTVAWVAGCILLAGLGVALFLPPGRGTCGMPPFGTNEFCGGNDYALKATVALGTLGLSAGFFSLAALRRWGGLIGALIVALTAIGISASVPDRLGCPPGRSLNYSLTITPDNVPLCSSSANPI